jgi:hypothetical protein
MAGASLEIAVQPPSKARLGATLDPPLAVMMRSTRVVNGYSSDLSQVWAFATLIDDYGKVVNDQLTGTLAESAHTLSSDDDSTDYFLFDNLCINRVGSFRIRVTLMRMDSGSLDAASEQQVESDAIMVQDQEVEQQLPSIATS